MDRQRAGGFTLLELLLALSLGTALFALLLRLIGADLRLGSAMAERLQTTGLQRRTLALIKAEIATAQGWMVDPPPSKAWPCALSGRRPVLALAMGAGDPDARGSAVIVYSVGRAPSAIWQGQVLMRCGPSYGLDGVINLEGAYQNRVLLDALPDRSVPGFSAQNHPTLPLLQLQLEQELRDRSGQHRRFQSRLDA
jgi:type II secretory pathway pseudopilin PulG